ncbi:3-demethylubiquinone-9 3-O-methyltransferase [Oscillatoria sp. FACHB-1407]|uniref:bifunctional 2-polyprenyl-6-hydroxyphenol methylase/3-demethylubiquinol 3-O-methyltransferase UbiG n=1 Tax=Oscillatoria sp. FACHB-1407 TaxID=2692847 RepID=UPI0016841EB3|nr:bifunctional 2-polyprenyl-6-hydroxyphenol methylase/3-demethylubiquinol 3-O-methyltransferase UbiG [Oscillatoria sp. FACHB-1407]MBD2460327.1 3-demethylubiquinone-9 3-O-methyltransferase [Oscillatoria sp. FACHB-1407]
MKPRNDLNFYSTNAKQWWDASAKIYALNHLNPPRFAYFDRHIPQWQGLNVLDIGCGGGYSCEFLARRGAIASGIDQSKACIVAAQVHAQANQLTIAYQHGHAEALPYGDRSFDVVVCVDVLEHVADALQTLREIYRVLKPGGIFCFDTINRTFKSKLIMIWLLEDLLREIPQGIHDWNKFITPNELTHWMQAIGFSEIEIKGFNVFGRTIFDNIAAYQYYQKTGNFRIHINDDISVMYIGVAHKPLKTSAD